MFIRAFAPVTLSLIGLVPFHSEEWVGAVTVPEH
jgi:hypothetical protein